jgi:hypothetical protein
MENVQSVNGDKVIVTTPDYFKIFSYEWLAGNPDNALKSPDAVVITEKRAHIYFGDMPLQEITGRTLIYNDSLHLTVTGVIKTGLRIQISLHGFYFSVYCKSFIPEKRYSNNGLVESAATRHYGIREAR